MLRESCVVEFLFLAICDQLWLPVNWDNRLLGYEVSKLGFVNCICPDAYTFNLDLLDNKRCKGNILEW